MTDLQMPVMNGYEFIEFCRNLHPRVPLIAMTGEHTPEVLKRLRALGVSVCFAEPFDYDEVAQRIRQELDSGRGLLDLVSEGISAAFAAARRPVKRVREQARCAAWNCTSAALFLV